jgi:hypothetical protein
MLTGPEFLTTFLYYFVCTTLIVVLVMSQGMGVSLESHFPYSMGMLTGLIAGAIGAYFNRNVTLSLPVTGDRKTFSKLLEKTFLEMGFTAGEQIEDFTVYCKSPLKTLFAGRILVKVEKDTVTLISRSSTVKRLQEQLNQGLGQG